MAADYARLREQTMGSHEEEEAVTVNTRALIDKVLARYSGEWTTLRELIQNAADAQAKKVTIRFETLPSANVPLPQSQNPGDHIKHVLLHHTLRTLLVSNDGEVFGENDWARLKRIAEGNPDETKIGAFGVGFYSVFADCESPFVSSSNQTMAFYWKKDSLFTRRGKLPDGQATKGTTFLLDYRSASTPVPSLLSLCQFLATSLTFVGLESIELHLDDWNIITLNKKMAPGAKIAIPKDVNPKTRDGLMKITDVEYQNAQIDARWMNFVGWDRRTMPTASNGGLALAAQQIDSSGASLRSWFSRFTSGTSVGQTSATKKAQKEEEILQQSLLDDLAGYSQATVFLRLSTVNVQTFVSRSLSAELERATKKPPPKHTKIAILTSSFDESSASVASGTCSKQSSSIFSSVLPQKNGKIFIGFPTAQTTGLLAHISAPSVIPTVERESIDLNARYVRDWNTEMLRVAGIACRIAFTGEMAELKNKLDRTMQANGRKRVTREDVDAVMASAIHTYKQFNFDESTPSAKVGQCIEEAFWMCNQKASIETLSTRGVLLSQQVRVATEDLSFVDGIPVIPDELMDKANEFIAKLRDYGLLSDITTCDIKKELEAQALTEKQVTELVKWACTKFEHNDLDAGTIHSLFDGTIASIAEEFVNVSPGPVLQLGQIKTFVNVAKVPAEMPTPPHTIPFRLTKGVNTRHLEALGWEELQIVPWLRYLIESDGHGFGASQSLTTSPAVASQVLPVISKAWDGLSNSSKQSIAHLLVPRTVIPTKLGMKTPPQSYFGNVKLFDDLPTITGLQGVKEKFLSTLGVRKTVELNVVFDRLMAKSVVPATQEEGKWSHVDLIKYLVSVSNDIPQEDLKRLKETPICSAEVQSADQVNKGKLYRLTELYEPSEAHRKLGLPVLQWPGQYRSNSPEGRFLRSLGLQPYPTVMDLVTILSKAPPRSELQQSAVSYFIVNNFQNGFNKYPMHEIDIAFLPVQPFAGESNNLIAKPRQCFANPQAAVLRFRTLREDLRPHHAMFGVAMDPPIDVAAERLIKSPPADIATAQVLFGFFSDRLSEIGPNGMLAEKLGDANIVPIRDSKTGEKQGSMRYVSPRSVFLGDDSSFGDIFDFVDFGPEANAFLLRVGSKHEPSASEIASLLVRQPARLLQTLGSEKYLSLLRRIADNAANLKKDKMLWQQLKQAPCLLAVKEVAKIIPGDEKVRDVEDEEMFIKEYSLASAPGMVIVDDFGTYRLFQSSLLTAPQEETLENLYSALDTPWLSRLVEDDQRMGALLNDQNSAKRLQKLIVERCRLFLHDHTADVIRHDGKWLEQNLTVKATEFLQVTRRLKGYRMQFVEKRTAALHRESKRDATLFVTKQCDLYEVSRAVMSLLLKRPRQQDFLALETILDSDLKRLRTKGYNVDRILRARAAESRIAETERQKREEEQRRQAEAEAAMRSAQHEEAQRQLTNGMAGLSMEEDAVQSETPNRQLSMPGAFENSPEQRAGSPGRGKKSVLSNITKALGIGNNSGNSQAVKQLQNIIGSGEGSVDLPPPYQPRDPNGGKALAPGTEQVTSPCALQQNLQSAVKASRPYNANSLFSAPQTNQIKETPSYCDNRPGFDLTFLHEFESGIKLFLSRHSTQSSTTFLETHAAAIGQFLWILREVAGIFSLPPTTVNIYYDDSGAAIAFNSNGSIFCNLRYFMQLHLEGMGSGRGKVEAASYWWITVCHELAHNLVVEHSSQHSYYTESFVAQFFARMVAWSGRVMQLDS